MELYILHFATGRLMRHGPTTQNRLRIATNKHAIVWFESTNSNTENQKIRNSAIVRLLLYRLKRVFNLEKFKFLEEIFVLTISDFILFSLSITYVCIQEETSWMHPFLFAILILCEKNCQICIATKLHNFCCTICWIHTSYIDC